jgi:hypothetical protein
LLHLFQTEELPLSLSRRIDTPPLRSSPDSSTNDDNSGFRCPHCPILCADESGLSDHLLRVHRVRLVKTEPATTTRCPVCRQLVTDLSHHFAMEHSEKKKLGGGGLMNNNNQKGSPTSSNGFVHLGESAKVIPIFLPSHPLPESQLGRKLSNGSSADDPVSPMNLSVRRSSDPETAAHVTLHVSNGFEHHVTEAHHSANNNNNSVIIPASYAARSNDDSEDFEESASTFSGEFQNSSDARCVQN